MHICLSEHGVIIPYFKARIWTNQNTCFKIGRILSQIDMIDGLQKSYQPMKATTQKLDSFSTLHFSWCNDFSCQGQHSKVSFLHFSAWFHGHLAAQSSNPPLFGHSPRWSGKNPPRIWQLLSLGNCHMEPHISVMHATHHPMFFMFFCHNGSLNIPISRIF